MKQNRDRMTAPHTSVLSEPFLHLFKGHQISTFIDGTLGAGGHAEAVLQEHAEITRFIGVDQDPTALEIAKGRLEPWKEKVTLKRGNFSKILDILKEEGIPTVDGMLLDLGVSSMQLDRPEKGFSFMQEGPLDMRMDPNNPLTAEEIVNTWSEAELGRVFRQYGEEKKWRAAARAIVKARARAPFRNTLELADVLYPVLQVKHKKKGIHPLTLVFQALRICVNRELEVLEETLPKAITSLNPGGLLAVISFHSLEDRIVKNTFRFAASDKQQTTGLSGLFLDKEPLVRILTRKPIIPTDAEVARNPRSRSAKLRVVERL